MARNKGAKAPEKLWLRSFAGREFPLPIVIISLLMLSYCARGGGTPVPENREAGVLDSSAAALATTVDSGTDVIQPFCGNGKVDQETEQCDITDLGEATCGSLGTLEGELGCNPDCTFNDLMCYPVVVEEETTSGSGAGGYGGSL